MASPSRGRAGRDGGVLIACGDLLAHDGSDCTWQPQPCHEADKGLMASDLSFRAAGPCRESTLRAPLPAGSWRQSMVPAGIQVKLLYRLVTPTRNRPRCQPRWTHSTPIAAHRVTPDYVHASWCPPGHGNWCGELCKGDEHSRGYFKCITRSGSPSRAVGPAWSHSALLSVIQLFLRFHLFLHAESIVQINVRQVGDIQ